MASPASPFTTIDDVRFVRMGEGPRLALATCSSTSVFGLPNVRTPVSESDDRETSIVGGAVDIDASVARARAHGEFWERYAHRARPYLAVADAAQRELPASSVGLHDILAGDRDPSFAGEQANADTRLDWVPGVHVRTGDPCYLPAEAVHLGYVDAQGRPPRFWQWTSSGTASARTSADALDRALCELIERDAVMRHWLRREAGEPVTVEEWSQLVDRRMVDALRSCAPWVVHVVQLRGIVSIPVVLAAFVHPGQHPAWAVGLACHRDVSTAYQKALLEAVQCLHAALHRPRPPHPPSVARGFEDRMWIYADPEQLEHVLWLVSQQSGESHVRVPRPEGDRSANAIDLLHRIALEVYASDITPRDARDVGCVVVRAVVPGLQLMEAGDAYRIVHPGRIGRSWDDVNPRPHPIA